MLTKHWARKISKNDVEWSYLVRNPIANLVKTYKAKKKHFKRRKCLGFLYLENVLIWFLA